MITVYSHSFAESPITHCWIQIHSWLLYPTEPLAGLRLSWMFRWICPPASLTVYCRLCSSAAADVRTWAAAIQEPGTWGDVWRWRSATLNPAGHGWPSCNDHLQCWRGDRWGNRLLLSPRDPPPPKRKWQRMCLKAGGAKEIWQIDWKLKAGFCIQVPLLTAHYMDYACFKSTVTIWTSRNFKLISIKQEYL